MVVHRFICKNHQIALFPYFIFIPQTGIGLPYLKQGLVFTVSSPKWECDEMLHGKNGFVAPTKLGTTNKIFVATTKNFAAATKRFLDRTNHFLL